MRVAQIIETMAMGGAENLAVHIAGALADRGCESHLIVIEDPGILSEKIPANVRVHHLGFYRASIRNPFRFVSSLRQGYQLLSDLIRAEGVEVVQTHLPGSNFWGLLLAWRKVCAVLATVHNNEEFRYGEIDNALMVSMRKAAYRQIIRRTQGVIAVSAAVRESLVQQLNIGEVEAARIAVVPNAVPVPAALNGVAREEIRHRFGVGEEEVFLLAAGRFTEQKNFGDLVGTAEHLKSSGVAFKLVIAGDGEDRPGVLAGIETAGLSDQVQAPGNLTDLGTVMQAADVFVLSSKWEGLPLVLLEAMAAGLPVAAYAIDGVTELVADRQTGRTVLLGDTRALASAIGELTEDPGIRAALGEAGRVLIEERFSFGVLVDRLMELYESARGELS